VQHLAKNSHFDKTFFIYTRKKDKKFGLLGTLQTLGALSRQSECILGYGLAGFCLNRHFNNCQGE